MYHSSSSEESNEKKETEVTGLVASSQYTHFGIDRPSAITRSLIYKLHSLIPDLFVLQRTLEARACLTTCLTIDPDYQDPLSDEDPPKIPLPLTAEQTKAAEELYSYLDRLNLSDNAAWNVALDTLESHIKDIMARRIKEAKQNQAQDFRNTSEQPASPSFSGSGRS